MNFELTELRIAHLLECELICDLRDDVARWLIRKGVRQMNFPTTREQMEREIEARERYVAVLDDRLTGSFRISLSQGPWPDTDPKTFYLSDLFIDREYAGLGAGSIVLEKAEGIVIKLGGHRMRLDCWAGNEKLRGFYFAFLSYRGDVPEKDYEVSLYERKIGT